MPPGFSRPIFEKLSILAGFSPESTPKPARPGRRAVRGGPDAPAGAAPGTMAVEHPPGASPQQAAGRSAQSDAKQTQETAHNSQQPAAGAMNGSHGDRGTRPTHHRVYWPAASG